MAFRKARWWRCRRATTLLAILFAWLVPGIAGALPAAEIRASVALPPTHPVVAGGWAAFQQAVAANHTASLRFRLFVNGAMVGSDRSLKALSQGEIDMGFLATPDYPDEFPYAAFIASLSMISKDGLAAAAAASELVLLHCAPCRDEYSRHNLAFLGTYSAASYLLMTKDPVGAEKSLKGRRVWSPGSPWDNVLREMAATPTRTERVASEALATGGADSVIAVPIALRQLRLGQQVKAVTLMPLGAYRGASPFTVNRDSWRQLTAAQRSVLLAAAPAGLVGATAAYDEQARAALERAQERGVALVSPSQGLVTLVENVSDRTIRQMVGSAQARMGVSGAAELIEHYRTLYAKYVGQLAEAPNAEAAAAVLRREIFAKLSPAEYALENDSIAETGAWGDGRVE